MRGAIAMLLAPASVALGIGVLGSSPASAATLGSNQQQVFDWFVSQGLNPVATAGLVGNLDYESGGVNPNASQCGSQEVAPPAGYCGVGIAQWTWGANSNSLRWEDLVGLANIKGESGVTFGTADPNSFPSLDVQEQYVWQELNTTYRPLLGQMQACAAQAPVSAAIQCATYAVQSGYEVPQNHLDENPNPGCASPPNFCTRYADAMAIYDAYAVPYEPTGVTIAGVNWTQVALSWQPSEAATGYTILRNGAVIGSTSTNSYLDTGLAAGASYDYTVEATNSNGVSSPSAATGVTTFPAISAFTASRATLPKAGGSLTLSAWSPGATYYNYLYAASSGGAPLKGWAPRTVWPSQPNQLSLTLPPNSSPAPKTYSFSAWSYNASGASQPATVAVTVSGTATHKAQYAGHSERAATGVARFRYQLTTGN